MATEQAVERASREVQEWMHRTTERAINDLMDDGRGLFAAKAPKAEELAFFLNEAAKVGLVTPDVQINPQARMELTAKYGESGYIQALEAANAMRVQALKDGQP